MTTLKKLENPYRPEIRRMTDIPTFVQLRQKAVDVPSEVYDELDCCLMATFPASDAVAKY